MKTTFYRKKMSFIKLELKKFKTNISESLTFDYRLLIDKSITKK